MEEKKLLKFVESQDWLDTTANAVQSTVLDAYNSGGEGGKKIKNFLHGTWLGHPLHPVLTDIPIGAWTTAAVLDSVEIMGNKDYQAAADAAIAVGLVGAAGSAISGLTDWTGTTKERRRIGLVHGLLNAAATALYATSYVLRKQKARGPAMTLAFLGYGISGVAAYLGGSLVYGKQVGVDHTATSAEYPTDYTPVLDENELEEGKMKCVNAGEIPVLLVKKEGKIFAIAHTCSHLGGPLSEGTLLEGCKVRCPWHNSVFSLADGSVVEGPATEPQPTFNVRVREGKIEVRINPDKA